MPTEAVSIANRTSLGAWEPGNLGGTVSYGTHHGLGALRLQLVPGTPAQGRMILRSGNDSVPAGSFCVFTENLRSNASISKSVISGAGSGPLGEAREQATSLSDSLGWRPHQINFIQYGTGENSLSVASSPASGAWATGDEIYLNAPSILWSTVDPPANVTVNSDQEIQWTNPALTIGNILPANTSVSITSYLRVSVEHRFNGGSWSVIQASALASTGLYDDPTPRSPGVNEYRLRYKIHHATSHIALGLFTYSAYSAVAVLGAGGWGVGMVRMGAN